MSAERDMREIIVYGRPQDDSPRRASARASALVRTGLARRSGVCWDKSGRQVAAYELTADGVAALELAP